MEEAIQALLSRAFHRTRAAEASQAIADVREREGSHGIAVSYECVIPPEGAVEHLVTRVLPRLVYFLECRGAHLPRCGGVFLSLFVGADLYFVRAADALEELSRMSGLSPEEMVRRYGEDGD